MPSSSELVRLSKSLWVKPRSGEVLRGSEAKTAQPVEGLLARGEGELWEVEDARFPGLVSVYQPNNGLSDSFEGFRDKAGRYFAVVADRQGIERLRPLNAASETAHGSFEAVILYDSVTQQAVRMRSGLSDADPLPREDLQDWLEAARHPSDVFFMGPLHEKTVVEYARALDADALFAKVRDVPVQVLREALEFYAFPQGAQPPAACALFLRGSSKACDPFSWSRLKTALCIGSSSTRSRLSRPRDSWKLWFEISPGFRPR